MTIWSDTRCAT